MNEIALNIPITKVDAARRLVYGVATAEKPDRVGEVCDYATTKPNYERWSADFAKTSAGKSFGNLRSMHGHIAAGKLTAINCNDAAKQIEICAKVVDDGEWNKVVEGVYTGFSQGGAYAKRWQDGDFTRYTAEPHEVSLVDLPCLPNATFEMIKADGAREDRPFKAAEAVDAQEGDPGFEPATIAKKTETPVSGGEWEQVWRSKRDGECFKKKEELYVHHAKLDADAVALEAAKPVLDAMDAIDADLRKHEAESAESADGNSIAGNTVHGSTEIKIAEKSSAKNDPQPTILSLDPSKLDKREFSEGERKNDAKSGAAEPDGSYPIENGEDLKNAVRAYGRSKDKAKTKAHIIARAKALGLTSELPDDWSTKIVESGEIEKAMDLVVDDPATKDFTYEIEKLRAELDNLAKRGARHSSADQGRIQDIHDKALELGADANARGAPSSLTTWEDLIAGLSTDTSRQMATMLKSQLEARESASLKAHSDSVVALLMPKLDDIAKRVKSIEDQPLPLPHRGLTRAVEKGHDAQPDDSAALETIAADPNLFEKLIKIAQSRPIPMIAKGG